MKFFDNYHLPTTVDEALELLARYDGRARVIAGGTDLLVDLQGEQYEGARPHYDALVDVTQIKGANEIGEDGDYIVIGCAVTHTQIEQSSLIQQHATALSEASSVVGGPQVRNVATLIGNVAHALPAADGTVALMVFDAEAQVVRRASAMADREWRPLSELFKGPGQSSVEATREIITAIRFRGTGAHEASAFKRVMRPQGVALPILGMAVYVRARGDAIESVAISAGPVAPVPFRASRTEEFLHGKSLTPDVVQQAAQILLNEAKPRNSPHRASREYRFELLPSLLEQTVRVALERSHDD